MQTNLAFEDEGLEELIDGKLTAMASPTLVHNFVSGNIYFIFRDYLRGKRCTPLADGTHLYLTKKDRFIPDGMVVCDPDKLRPDGVHGAPDLVVEVLSPGTAKNDKGHKKDVYEACGVREYWIVSPGERSVEQYVLTDGRFVLRDVYSQYPRFLLDNMKEEERAAIPTEFHCTLFDDLSIRLEDVFYRVDLQGG